MNAVGFLNRRTIEPDEVVTITSRTRVLRITSLATTRERQTVREFQLPWPGRVVWVRLVRNGRRLSNLKLAAVGHDGELITFYPDRVIVTREQMSSRLRVDGPEAGRIFPAGTRFRATTFYARRACVDLPEAELLIGIVVGASSEDEP